VILVGRVISTGKGHAPLFPRSASRRSKKPAMNEGGKSSPTGEVRKVIAGSEHEAGEKVAKGDFYDD
jgi:hypothetical protein